MTRPATAASFPKGARPSQRLRCVVSGVTVRRRETPAPFAGAAAAAVAVGPPARQPVGSGRALPAVDSAGEGYSLARGNSIECP